MPEAAPVADSGSNPSSEEELVEEPESVSESGGESSGEMLGAEAPQKERFKLNFYIVVGILGLIIGSGGLVLGFRLPL